MDEYCPIYLGYLGKYRDYDKIKYCKNSNEHYCEKYKLIAPDSWKRISKEDRLKFLQNIHLIDFVENIKDKKDRENN